MNEGMMLYLNPFRCRLFITKGLWPQNVEGPEVPNDRHHGVVKGLLFGFEYFDQIRGLIVNHVGAICF